ncbi:hypothetical protein D3C78_1450810 [compost metagenome]
MQKLTNESILNARQWFIENLQACIREAQAGTFHVNDLPAYVANCQKRIKEFEEGRNDHTFSLRQTAYYIQTGESLPLLP